MGLTSARVLDGNDVWGAHGVCIRKFTGDNSYPSGGYSLQGSNFGFGNKPLEGVAVLGALTALGATFNLVYDALNKKLVVNAGGASEYNYVPGGGDILGSAATSSENADAAAAATNGSLVDTGSAVAAGAWTYGEDAEPDVSRNLVITIENPTGGALNLFEGVTSFAVTGTFRGAAQTDTITFTSTAGNKSVAAAKFRYKYGVKPFDTVTNVVMTDAPDNDLVISVGIGSLLGLPVPTLNNAESDIIKITKNGADLSPTGLYSTNQTVNLGTMSDGADVAILYRASGAAAPGTDLSGCTWLLLGICRGT